VPMQSVTIVSTPQAAVDGSSGKLATITGTVLPGLTNFFRTISDSLPSLFDMVLGLGTTFYWYYLVRTPWDNYFATRSAAILLEKNKEEGLEVNEKDYRDAKYYETWLLRGALGLHIFSAAGVYGISRLTDAKFINAKTAWIFLASALIRPALAAHSFVKKRIAEIFGRAENAANRPEPEYVKFRRELVEFSARIVDHTDFVKQMREHTLPEISENHAKLSKIVNQNQQKEKEDFESLLRQIRETSQHCQGANQELKTSIQKNAKLNLEQFDTVSRKFEETVTKLDSDKRMIEGVKAFCQLVRANLLENQNLGQ